MLVGAVAMVGCKDNDERTPQGGNQGGNQGGGDEPAKVTWCDYLYTWEVTTTPGETEYAIGEYDLSAAQVEGKYVWEHLNYASFEEMAEALGTLEDRKASNDNELLFWGYDPVTKFDVENPSTSNGFGHWVNASGSPVSWGDETRAFTENISEEGMLTQVGAIGIRPGLIVEGETYVVRELLIRNVDDETSIRVGLEFTIKVETFVDTEVNDYNAANRQIGTFDVTYERDLSVAEYGDSYDGITIEATEIQNYLQLTKYQFSLLEPIIDDAGLLYSGYTFQHFLADRTEVSNGAGGKGGSWLNAKSEQVAYMAGDSVLCIEFVSDAKTFGPHICFQPENIEPKTETDETTGETTTIGTTAVKDAIGSTITFKQTLSYLPESENGDASKMTIVNITYKVNIVE